MYYVFVSCCGFSSVKSPRGVEYCDRQPSAVTSSINHHRPSSFGLWRANILAYVVVCVPTGNRRVALYGSSWMVKRLPRVGRRRSWFLRSWKVMENGESHGKVMEF